MRKNVRRKQGQPAQGAIVSCVMEELEIRCLLSTTVTLVPTLSASAEDTGVYGVGTYMSVAGQNYQTARTGSTFYQGWGFLEIGANSFPKAYQVNDVTSLTLGLYNTAAAGSTGFDAVAGNFDVYVLPDDTTDFRTALFNTSYANGLGSQFSASGATDLGTAAFAGALGNTNYTFSSLSSTAQQAIVNDLNNNTPIRLAIVPDSATFAADWEGVVGYSGGAQNPTVSITLDPVTAVAEQVAFNSPTYTVSNNLTGGNAVFTVLRTGNTTDTASVHYATGAVGDTAVAGTNYTASSGTVNFAVGQTVATFTVPILAGTNNPTFTLTLTNPSGGTNLSLGSQSTATVTITNPSAATNNLTADTPASGGTMEVDGAYGTYAQVCGSNLMENTTAWWQELTVLDFSKATTPGLYPATGYTVTSLQDMSLQLDNVGTTGNYIGTAGNFNVYFVPNNMTLGGFAVGDFIYDGSLDVNGLNGQGGAGPATLLGTFSFDAQAGYDTFMPASIPAGVQTAILAELNAGTDIQLAITPESSTFKVEWGSHASLTSAAKLSFSATTLQTAQAETLSLSASTYQVNETAGTVTITVTRGGYTGDTASVQYATSDDSAAAGTNYTATSGTLNFTDTNGGTGTDISASFTVPITDVIGQGGNKVFTVTLSDPASGNAAGSGNTPTTLAVLGQPSSALVTIVDTASTSNTETLTQYNFDAETIEKSGPYATTYLNVAGEYSSNGYASFGVMDFNSADYVGPDGVTPETFVPTHPVTAINSISLQVINTNHGTSGPMDVYLVPNTTTSIDPGSGTSLAFNTSTVEGLGTQLGAPLLLGQINWDSTTSVGGWTTISLTGYTQATENLLIGYLNNTTAFRLVITPETTTVYASFAGDVYYTNTATPPVTTYEAPQLSFNVTETPPFAPGDTNHDGVLNSLDIDAIFAHLGAATTSQWKVDGDGTPVGQGDVTYELHTYFDSNYGDANLDGKTDFSDFQVVLDHWQVSGIGWAQGDFNGDGKVDFLDFQTLLSYWNPAGWNFSQGDALSPAVGSTLTAAAATATVPTPASTTASIVSSSAADTASTSVIPSVLPDTLLASVAPVAVIASTPASVTTLSLAADAGNTDATADGSALLTPLANPLSS